MDIGAPLRFAMQDSVGPAFELLPVTVAVLAQWACVEVILRRKTLHAAGLMVPGKGQAAADAAMFALDAKTLFEVAGNCDCQLEVSQAAVGKGDIHEPAVPAEAFQIPRTQLHDFAL